MSTCAKQDLHRLIRRSTQFKTQFSKKGFSKFGHFPYFFSIDKLCNDRLNKNLKRELSNTFRYKSVFFDVINDISSTNYF